MTAVVTVSDFEVGVDKISIGSGFFSVSSPSLSTITTDTISVTANNISVFHSGSGDTVVHLNSGDADQYLEVQLSGVTTISISDFEIL